MTTTAGHPSNWIRIGEQARCALGAVTQTGLQIKTRPWTGFERGYRYFGQYAAVLLVEGHGSYEDDRGQRFDLEPGDLTLVFPDVGHRYGPAPGATSHELFAVFDGSVFDGWYAEGVLSADRAVTRLGDPGTWTDRLTDIVLPEARSQADALVEVTRMQAFLAEALHSGGVGLVSFGRSEWTQSALRTIDATMNGKVDWDEVAADLGVSPVTFRRRIREHLGISPVTYRNRRIVGKACALMQQTDLSDQAIADTLGFCDPQYFSRCFRRIVGSSPREYRASLP